MPAQAAGHNRDKRGRKLGSHGCGTKGGAKEPLLCRDDIARRGSPAPPTTSALSARRTVVSDRSSVVCRPPAEHLRPAASHEPLWRRLPLTPTCLRQRRARCEAAGCAAPSGDGRCRYPDPPPSLAAVMGPNKRRPTCEHSGAEEDGADNGAASLAAPQTTAAPSASHVAWARCDRHCRATPLTPVVRPAPAKSERASTARSEGTQLSHRPTCAPQGATAGNFRKQRRAFGRQALNTRRGGSPLRTCRRELTLACSFQRRHVSCLSLR